MKRFVYYFVICFLVASMMPVDVFALEEEGSQPITLSSLSDASPQAVVAVATDDTPLLLEPQADSREAPQHSDEGSSMITTGATSLVQSQNDAPKLLISEVRLRGCINETPSCASTSQEASFVELYNPSPMTTTVSNWKLRYVVANKTGFGSISELAVINLQLDGYSYAVVGREGLMTRGAPLIPIITGGSIGSSSQGYIQLLDGDSRVVDIVGWGSVATLAEGSPAKASDLNNSMQRCEDQVGFILDSDNNKADFLQYDFATPGTGIRCAAPEPIIEVNDCDGLHISEIAANTAADSQFIELHNRAAHDIATAGCQLQTNRSMTLAYILPDETIPADGYRAVYIRDTSLTLTKTTTGTVYLVSSDGKNETDARQYSNLAVDTSWAWFGDEMWHQTYSVTPGGVNVDQPYMPCDEGYVRNQETGRCNKIVSITPVPCADNQYRSEETGRCRTIATLAGLIPCKDGQYRSEQTNRCRNIVLAGSTLTPCKDNQYRSEETNRCRSIVMASTNLVPCKDNQYRSEETNRCRNIAATAIPEAAFAVTPVKEAAGKAFIGWWALGGVGLLAAGYGAWEWRREVLAGARKVGSFFRSHQ